jgi:hypothetical protein
MSTENNLKKEAEDTKKLKDSLKKIIESAKIISDQFGRKPTSETDKTGVKVNRVVEEEI